MTLSKTGYLCSESKKWVSEDVFTRFATQNAYRVPLRRGLFSYFLDCVAGKAGLRVVVELGDFRERIKNILAIYRLFKYYA